MHKGFVHGELVARRKDGWLFDVEYSASLVMDSKGYPLCMLASFMDITERKKFKENLEQSEKEFRTLFMESPVSVLVHDKDTREIISANPGRRAQARGWGWPPLMGLLSSTVDT